MSDSPETDAFYAQLYDARVPPDMVEDVSGKERAHACQLELSRDAARRELAEANLTIRYERDRNLQKVQEARLSSTGAPEEMLAARADWCRDRGRANMTYPGQVGLDGFAAGWANGFAAGAAPQSAIGAPFQFRVAPWMHECFGPAISADVVERNHRFIEESLELVQSTGCTASEAHQLVDYVFGRPQGVAHQEAGGVMVTLAALCLALGLDMHKAGEDELARIWTKIEKIRSKQAAKPPHSPFPAAPTDDAGSKG